MKKGKQVMQNSSLNYLFIYTYTIKNRKKVIFPAFSLG